MLIGHIDGKGLIYDHAGYIILRSGEQLLLQVTGDNIDVSEGSGIRDMQALFPRTAEKGQMFLTDQRLVFIRKPNAFLAAKNSATVYGMADAIANAIRAADLKKMDAWEFCQIDYIEVEGFWVKKRKAGVLFLASPTRKTRKALLYRKQATDRKLDVLKATLSKRLPVTEPEDRKGNFLLGARYPFLKSRHPKSTASP